MKQNMKNKKN